MTRLLPIDSYSGRIDGSLLMSGARGEVVDKQLVLLAGPAAWTGADLAFSDLLGPGTAKISHNLLRWRQVGSVQTRKPYYATRYVGQWPDPLLPAAPFDVAASGRSLAWIDLRVPTVAAGEYRGTITVSSKTAPAIHIPIKVHVWDFALPRQNHLRTSFGVQGQGNRIPNLPAIYDDMLAHRISPLSSSPAPRRLPPLSPGGPNQWDWTAYDANVTTRLAQGMTCFDAFIDRNNPPADIWQSHLASKGWLPLAYTYVADEPTGGQLAGINNQLGQIKQQAPDIPNLITARGYPGLLSNLDIYCPSILYFNPDRSLQVQASGKQSWWYPAYPTQHPMINVWTDYPALDCRIWPWMTWKYNLDGMLYWSVCYFGSTPNPMQLAPAFGGGDGFANGDGQFLYPGPDGRPLDSIRWEALRDGMQDYEVFCLLEAGVAEMRAAHKSPELIAQGQVLLHIRPDVLTTYRQYSDDPRDLLQARDEMSMTLEKIVRTLGHEPRITARPRVNPQIVALQAKAAG